jgi:hypothetical protein
MRKSKIVKIKMNTRASEEGERATVLQTSVAIEPESILKDLAVSFLAISLPALTFNGTSKIVLVAVIDPSVTMVALEAPAFIMKDLWLNFFASARAYLQRAFHLSLK